LVEDVVATGDGFLTIFIVADIAFDEGIVRVGQKGFNVFTMAGHEVIEAHYLIALIKQRLREVGAYEACSSGDEDGRVGKGSEVYHLISCNFFIHER